VSINPIIQFKTLLISHAHHLQSTSPTNVGRFDTELEMVKKIKNFPSTYGIFYPKYSTLKTAILDPTLRRMNASYVLISYFLPFLFFYLEGLGSLACSHSELILKL
jgi:hypothetical protein